MLLELNGVSKTYGNVQALKDVSFGVDSGEWVSIMGPSGSGKTTLLNIIGCLDKPTSGVVMLDGADLSSLDAKQLTEVRRDKIGLIFQQFHLIPHLTALENIMVAQYYHSMPDEIGLIFQQFHLIPHLTALENIMVAQYYHSMPDEREALGFLSRVGLADRARHFPSQLSGGEQQRVCVARALINYPRLILADEPTGNLDEANEKIVIEIIQELHREGHTIVMVTHDDTIGQLADREIRLQHGRVVDKYVDFV